jgi:RNA polymerase sigma-70 factor (ECF subfamily)
MGGRSFLVDPDLIRAAKAGDRDAVVALLRQIETHVYRTAYYFLGNEHDAMDASQEAMLKIYTKIGSYEEKAMFKTWVQRIVTNVCIDKFRRAKPTVSIEAHDMIFSAGNQTEEQVMAASTAQEVREAIDRLPDQQRAVVVLRYLQDFSYKEIADSLNLPLNTVKSYLFRARQQLQTMLQEEQKGGVTG